MTTDPNIIGSGESVAPVLPSSSRRSGLARYAAWGTGVGIELREKELTATIVRVRPSETGVLGAATVTDYQTRPAAEWGAELHAFLRKMGVGHVAATVLLPRREVIVRAIPMPGVSDGDLEAAIRLQMDSLHPFADEDVCFSWARLPKTAFALVGIVRRPVVDAWSALFAEAGLKVASFTFSAGAIYSALRLITTPPYQFLVAHESDTGIELYGESESRPVYTATLALPYQRAVAIARSELRLDPDTPSVRLAHLLPRPSLFPDDYDPNSPRFETHILPYATALTGACPWLGLEANLLPPELRRGSSRLRLIPTFTFAAVLLVLLAMLAFQQSWADARYLGVLQHQIRRYEPTARKVDTLDKTAASVRARSQSLDEFRRRARLDIDSMAEITKLIPAPGWVTNLDMDRQTVQIAGEVDQAAALLKTVDGSPLFEKSEFTMPITRSVTAEMFRIRAQRTVPPRQAPQSAAAAQGTSVQSTAAPAKAPETAPVKPANSPAPLSGSAPNPFLQPSAPKPAPGGAK